MGCFGRRGGRGGGRGWRNMFHATGLTGWQRDAAPAPPPQTAPEEQRLAGLRAQADELATALEQIRQRVNELEAASSQEAGTE